jgi:hypothetical protein
MRLAESRTGYGSRIDPRTGITEVAEFFGPNSQRSFGVRHLPAGEPVGGLVICSPLQAEHVRNYRREVFLGRALAAKGVTVQRFHYRGFGHSDGHPEEATLHGMKADALAAAHLLAREHKMGRIAFLGTRWGSLVAAAAVKEVEGAPLILWEPLTDPRRYFREVLRARLFQDLKEGTQGSGSVDALLRELQETGVVDVLGFAIGRQLYNDAAQWRIDRAVGTKPHSVLLIQVDRGSSLRRDHSILVSALKACGCTIETRIVERQEPWWFGGGGIAFRTEEETGKAGPLVTHTLNWLLERFGAVSEQ